MNTSLTCPRCAARYSVPVTLENVTFSGNARNVVAPCPRCDHHFDAAPGDGTYSTIGGELRRVADYIAHSSATEVAELRRRLDEVQRRRDVEDAVKLLEAMGWRPPATSRSRLETANLAMDIVQKLVIILGILVTAGAWTTDQVQQLFAHWF